MRKYRFYIVAFSHSGPRYWTGKSYEPCKDSARLYIRRANAEQVFFKHLGRPDLNDCIKHEIRETMRPRKNRGGAA